MLLIPRATDKPKFCAWRGQSLNPPKAPTHTQTARKKFAIRGLTPSPVVA